MGCRLILKPWFTALAVLPSALLLTFCSALVNPDPDSLTRSDGDDADIFDVDLADDGSIEDLPEEDTMDVPDDGIADPAEDEQLDTPEADPVADSIEEDMVEDVTEDELAVDGEQDDLPADMVEEDIFDIDIVEEDPLDEDLPTEDVLEEDTTDDEAPYCGNNIKDGDDVCDGDDLGSPTPGCSDHGFGSGTLNCLEDCTGFDFSECIDGCGNGRKEGTEVCDGDDTGEETCLSQGYVDGILRCNEICSDFDVSGCPADCSDQPDFTLCVIVTDPDRDYDICIDGDCRSPGCGDATCNPPGPHFDLPDTNQRTCYNGTTEIECPGTPGEPSCTTTDWCGQDAQYGWDTEHEATERFTRTGTDEPVVLDKVTGLEWQGCLSGQSGSDCAGSNDTYSWQNALSYCDGLTWADFDDWRLPDRYELHSIVDCSKIDPAIDDDAFPGTPSSIFWSLSTYQDTSSYAWYVEFLYGDVRPIASKASAFPVRCVRSSIVGRDRFTRAGSDEPVVADNATGLVWQGCPAGKSESDCTGSNETYNWHDSLSYCEGLDWGGHEDWRLPDTKELASIVDDRHNRPSIDSAAFPGTQNTYFWSSSTFTGALSYTWHVEFTFGDVRNNTHKSSAFAVRCVRVP